MRLDTPDTPEGGATPFSDDPTIPPSNPVGDPPPPWESGERPVINVSNKQFRDLVRETWDAIVAQKDNGLYMHFGAVSTINPANDLRGARIETATAKGMRGLMSEAADWIMFRGAALVGGKGVRRGPLTRVAKPPIDIADLMIERGDDRLPTLHGLSRCPFFDPNGRLVSTPGYDIESGIYLDCDVEPILPAGVSEAIALIDGVLLKHFPFHAPSDRTHAWALLLLPFVRRMFRGVTPLHLVESPVMGTGKGKLVNVASIVATGRPAQNTTVSDSEDETRKRITSMLLTGALILYFDNVQMLETMAFASAITTDIWGDRELAKNKMFDIPNEAIWVATGNNVLMHEDFPRRCLRIRLDARTERPWDRANLPDITAIATRDRAKFMGALISCIQYWIDRGSPSKALRRGKGSFEAWRDLIGGILETLDRPDFLASDREIEATGVLTNVEWARLVIEWDKAFGDQWASASQLIGLIDQRDLLPSVLGDLPRQKKMILLSKQIMQMRGRVINGFTMRREHDPYKNQAEYRLTKADEDPA